MHSETAAVSYRSDIDGLRSLAILAVVAYHAAPEFVSGGFIGVDVFFVISGFLISGIILNGLTNNSFRFRTFYARRIKRLFPALIPVLLTSYILGWFLLLPYAFRQLGEHMLAGAGFSSNILLWGEVGYFDKVAELKPLLHLWSLGVEEQFYIIFPLLLFFVFKKRFLLLPLLLILFFASLGLALYLVVSEPLITFYSPFTRFWELLAGSLLACVYTTPRSRHSISFAPSLRHAGSFLGVALIVISAFYFTKNQPLPGWRTLFPISGACLLIASGPQAFFNRYLLSRRALVFTGLISYPLYLWHCPLLAFTRIYTDGEPSLALRLSVVFVSFFLAFLTYRFIEKPIRFSASSSRKIPVLCFFMGAIAFLGASLLFSHHGQLSRFPEKIRPYAAYRYDYEKDSGARTCWLVNAQKPDAFADQCIDTQPSQKPLIMVWGDSHAAMFFPGLKIAAKTHYRLAQLTRDSCPPLLHYAYPNCVKGNEYVVEKIKALKPDTVILFAVWNHYSTGDANDPVLTKLPLTIQTLKDAGVRHIIVMGPAPQWNDWLPNVLVKDALKTGSSTIASRSFAGLESSPAATEAMLQKRLSAFKEVQYFSALDAMCNESGCLTTVNGQADGLVIWDYGHLTTAGATYLANRLLSFTETKYYLKSLK